LRTVEPRDNSASSLDFPHPAVQMSLDPIPFAGLADRTLPGRVSAYLDAVLGAVHSERLPLASLVIFGSAVVGGYAEGASDVDLILVVPDGTGDEERLRLRAIVEAVEALHGLRAAAAAPAARLDRFAQKVTANVRSFFVCTRSDLLSGEPARILGIPRAQGAFVDRSVVPSIVGSARTVWGEQLLPKVPLPPIRRRDVVKAGFGLCSQVLLSAALYPFVPAATKYAMGAMKRSVQNCHVSRELRPAPLAVAVARLEARYGVDRTLAELMALRAAYRPSFGFVLRCLPTIARLHLRTALGNSFPRQIPPTPDVTHHPEAASEQ
jgi:hypothetical protein